jgi:hypothetical protein
MGTLSDDSLAKCSAILARDDFQFTGAGNRKGEGKGYAIRQRSPNYSALVERVVPNALEPFREWRGTLVRAQEAPSAG